MTHKAIIIGAGIGGLTTAVALRQAGIDVTVYEQAAEIGRVGAGLTLWSNALQALSALGLETAVVGAGCTLDAGGIRTSSGTWLSRVPTGELSRRLGAPTVGIHRASLHAVLLNALPADVVQLGAPFVGFTQMASEVVVELENGRTDHADLLIGADGINSAVRAQLFPQARPRYAGYTAWRGLAPLDERTLGRTAFETWGRGKRFGVVRIAPDELYWFATANWPAGKTLPDPAAQKRWLLAQFGTWHAPIPTVLDTTPEDTILHNDIYDLLPLARWSQGSVTLLGDAAHATTPNLGQGACQAIESAVVLGRLLATRSALSDVLQAYADARRPRTAQIEQESWRVGRVGQLEHPLACALRNAIFRLLPNAITARRFERLFQFAA